MSCQLGSLKRFLTFLLHQQDLPILLSFNDQVDLGLIIDLKQLRVLAGEESLPLVLAAEARKDVMAHIKDSAAKAALKAELDAAAARGEVATVADVPPVKLSHRPLEGLRIPARGIAPALRPLIDEWASKGEADGILERAPEARVMSPLHVVVKPEKKPRVVIDYRGINTYLEDHGYPIPDLQQQLWEMRPFTHFSVIDLRSAFHHVPLDEASRDLTAINIPGRGTFRFTVLPFGLKPSPTIFQQVIEGVLAEVSGDGVIKVFIDDIVICAMSEAECLQKTREILALLRKRNFSISPEKLQLCVPEIRYLGHVVGHGTLAADPKKIELLLQLPRPQTRDGLHTFICAAGYLRSHLPQFATLAQPLTEAVKGRGPLLWTPVMEESFELLRRRLTEAVKLAAPTYSQPFHLFVDASNLGFGAALMQKDEAGEWVPLLFASKKACKTQAAWCPTDREVYAVLWGLRTVEKFILGSEIVVYTDHKALIHLDTAPSAKLMRYALEIKGYGARIEHVAGTLNPVADWLSRLDLPDDDGLPLQGYALLSEAPPYRPLRVELLTAKRLSEAAKAEGFPDGCVLREGLVFDPTGQRGYVPSQFREQLMFLAHVTRGRHVGQTKTYTILKRGLWWPTMIDDIAEYINGCPLCQCLRDRTTAAGASGSLSITSDLGALVSLDYVGYRTFRGQRCYFLIVTDHATRFAMGSVTTNPDAAFAYDFLRYRWIPIFGVPTVLLTDNNPFGGNFSEQVEKNLGIRHRTSFTYYPQGNGLTESSHRLIEHTLAVTVTKSTELESGLQEALMAHNFVPHQATGESPYFLVFGKDPNLPGAELFTRNYAEEERLIRLQDSVALRAVFKRLEFLRSLEGEPISNIKANDLVVYLLPGPPPVRPLQHVEEVPQ